MTLKQPFKLNDIQTKSLAVTCAVLIMLLTWAVTRMDRGEAECREDKMALQAKNDSINRIVILDLKRALEINRMNDSILRSKTQKQVEAILNNQDEKSKK